MLLIAAAALAVSSQPATAARTASPVVQARVTVRIVAGARLRLDGEPNRETPMPRETLVRLDGTDQPAKLIEFE